MVSSGSTVQCLCWCSADDLCEKLTGVICTGSALTNMAMGTGAAVFMMVIELMTCGELTGVNEAGAIVLIMVIDRWHKQFAWWIEWSGWQRNYSTVFMVVICG